MLARSSALASFKLCVFAISETTGLLLGTPFAGSSPRTMDLANFWDSPLVSSVAFHRRAAQPSSGSGSVRDGVFTMSDGAKVCYRLRLPTQGACDMVVYHFHGNAEVCTDADAYSALFTSSKAALLSIDFRGTPVLASTVCTECPYRVRTWACQVTGGAPVTQVYLSSAWTQRSPSTRATCCCAKSDVTRQSVFVGAAVSVPHAPYIWRHVAHVIFSGW